MYRRLLSRVLFLVIALGAGSIAGAAEVGYYDMNDGRGNPTQVAPIVQAGHTPVMINDLSAAELAAIDVLVVQNPSNSYFGSEYLSRFAEIEAAVQNGLVLIIHDRKVSDANMILPGGSGLIPRRWPNNNIDVLDDTTLVTDGPGGRLNDDSLDGIFGAHHGYLETGAIPQAGTGILSTGSSLQAVTACYPYGSGFVIYSTIPLDAYLAGYGYYPQGDNMRDIYAPNVVAYGAAGACWAKQFQLQVHDARLLYLAPDSDELQLKAGYRLNPNSDGIDPASEEVTVLFGNWEETIPEGSFLCDEAKCTYESEGPGITRAVIDNGAIVIFIDGIDLGETQHPVSFLWTIGNDTGEALADLSGTLTLDAPLPDRRVTRPLWEPGSDPVEPDPTFPETETEPPPPPSGPGAEDLTEGIPEDPIASADHYPVDVESGSLYLASLFGPHYFARYDLATNTWSTLGLYNAGAQMAASVFGDLYALNRDTLMIQLYDREADSWSDVIAAPPGVYGAYGNLEVTPEGEFLYTEGYVPVAHRWTGEEWIEYQLSFQPNVVGDYDPLTGQYVVGQLRTGHAHLLDLDNGTDAVFDTGPDNNFEIARFGVALGNRFYFQYAGNGIHSYDLLDNTAEAVDHTGSYGGSFDSAAVDRKRGKIYISGVEGSWPSVFSSLKMWDPETAAFSTLASYQLVGRSTLVFVPSGTIMSRFEPTRVVQRIDAGATSGFTFEVDYELSGGGGPPDPSTEPVRIEFGTFVQTLLPGSFTCAPEVCTYKEEESRVSAELAPSSIGSIHPGSLVCVEEACVYEGEEPGITEAVITPSSIFVRAGGIDLTEDINPLEIAVAIGSHFGMADARLGGLLQLDHVVVCSSDPSHDADGDGRSDHCDNCPGTANPGQIDTERDHVGDLCDNCIVVGNTDQLDSDSDGAGDACDPCPYDPDDDADGDGVCGDVDNCPWVANTDQVDIVHPDTIGDACDDPDSDGIFDLVDNCPDTLNSDQANQDGDYLGDACDPYPDYDLIVEPVTPSHGLTGIPATVTYRLLERDRSILPNLTGVQVTLTLDGSARFGEATQEGLLLGGGGTDRALVEFVDGLVTLEIMDESAELVVISGEDTERMGIGFSDVVFNDFESGDGGFTHYGSDDPWEWGMVRWPNAYSGENAWATGLVGHYNNGANGTLQSPRYHIPFSGSPELRFQGWFEIPECCDRGALEISADGGAHWYRLRSFWDEVGAFQLYTYNLDAYRGTDVEIRFHFAADAQYNARGWLIDDFALFGLVTSLEFLDPVQDGDGDGILNGTDNCAVTSNADQTDVDQDGSGDACDRDDDDDDIPDGFDNCPVVSNPDQLDSDVDHAGDACDPCPFDRHDDADGDGHCADVDNCPLVANADQADEVNPNGIGDACDDPDDDGVYDAVDNCPMIWNEDQADHIHPNGIGDACEDFDGDGSYDKFDNCPGEANSDQANRDGDELGDACDPYPDHDLVVELVVPGYGIAGRPATVSYRLLDRNGIFLADLTGARLTLTLGGSARFGETVQAGLLLGGGGTNRALVEFIEGVVIVDVLDDPAEVITLSGEDTESIGIEIGDIVYEDFETNDGHFTHYGTREEWEWGVPNKAVGPGPRVAYSGQRVWATDLDGMFNTGSNGSLESPKYRVPDSSSPELAFWSWFDSDYYDDRGYVEISTDDGSTWSQLQTFRGYLGGWLPSTYDLHAYRGSVIRIRFRLQTGPGLINPGWYIDDFTLLGLATTLEFLDPAEDSDADGVLNGTDNCTLTPNVDQVDVDQDGAGDACDSDDDDDGILDEYDNCPAASNQGQLDSDQDGVGDVCDNCVDDSNADQTDSDSDGIGDDCDNCVSQSNQNQSDSDSDGIGDVCDNCALTSNPDQQNSDGDAFGNSCDVCINDPENDSDSDGHCGNVDNCPDTSNADQFDSDGDAFGDVCDDCPNDAGNDIDNDLLCADVDNCPFAANPDQADGDGDGAGDVCDNCLDDSNPDQADADNDGDGDVCDSCPLASDNDADEDGICGNLDNCPRVANPDQLDSDGDGEGDVCDSCPFPPGSDGDGDGWCDEVDNCPVVYNPNQVDTDGDGVGVACDNCPDDANPDQADNDLAEVRQWASGATASSEYDSQEYAATQATGVPTIGGCTDSPRAWAPLEGGDGPEWLELTYDQAVKSTGVEVYETLESRFVTRIELIEEGTGVYHTIWEGADDTVCGAVFAPTWSETPYFATGIRIHTQVSGWEEIDAVEIIGLVGGGVTDGIGDVCDNCPSVYNPGQIDNDNDGIGDACE